MISKIDEDYENEELIKSGERTYSFENTMYGTPGPERLVRNDEAEAAMDECVKKRKKSYCIGHQ